MSEMSKEIRSEVTADGKLKIYIESVPMPVPGDGEVLLKVEASPINPSDLGLLIGPADVSSMAVEGTGDDAVVTMDIPENVRKMLAARVDQSLPVGNEGAGEVVAAGAGAEGLVGSGGRCCRWAIPQYRVVPASNCLVMHDGTTAEQAASCFVNPLPP